MCVTVWCKAFAYPRQCIQRLIPSVWRVTRSTAKRMSLPSLLRKPLWINSDRPALNSSALALQNFCCRRRLEIRLPAFSTARSILRWRSGSSSANETCQGCSTSLPGQSGCVTPIGGGCCEAHSNGLSRTNPKGTKGMFHFPGSARNPRERIFVASAGVRLVSPVASGNRLSLGNSLSRPS